MSKILFLLQFLLLLPNILCWINENRRIEEEILRNYDRRHRPVKRESTVTQVQLFLTINHIEKVDQSEGTMLLHGVLWTSWTDEYLQWNPSEHNYTYVVSLETWKIWQPTFALYNSARSTNWFVYMNGVSATVANDGKVVAAGTFTFHVTCQFDFSAFPNDVQECPIVLADWIFDNSKVNLSGMAPRSIGGINVKPAVRLSFDPLSETVKKHVSGWEIIDTWQRQCLWGPGGFCISDSPIGPLDTYWSLMEFGVKIKRHSPYIGLTVVAPMCVTIILTLLLFWLENLELAINIYGINLLLEAFSGWVLTQQIPPGDGVMPTIGVIHIWNVSLTMVALIFHCIMLLMNKILPPDLKLLPDNFAKFSSILNRYKLFKTECLSIDPQKMGFDLLSENNADLSAAGDQRIATNGGDVLFEFDQSPIIPPTQQNVDNTTIIQMDPIVHESGYENNIGISPTKTAAQFESVQLEAHDHASSSAAEQLSTVPTTSKKAFSLNLPLFSGKNGRTKKGIKTPFSTGAELFGGSNEILSNNEQLESTDLNAQLVIKQMEGGDNRPKESVGGGVSDEKNGTTNAEKSKMATVIRSPLEEEFGFVRRLMFTLYCLVSAILLTMLLL
ncbi:hypothetical protein niasHT_037185 [Heterodera trifolii]|uniref:Neurotransmitter-gated ion-channel ligand-binding domain-containing protein n=1 Tax=Heterodera trifolii TaxID=157864 RepID=A0ABD2HWH3_9BILA